MPVECNVELKVIDQERFHAVDKTVMRLAFDLHNEVGRFFDERVYHDELVRRCEHAGFEVNREVRLRAVHKDFSRLYFMDMVIDRGLVYEVKAVEAINAFHEKQLINYILLAHLKHGKIVNFRPSSVEYRFVSTRLCREDRTAFCLEDDSWEETDPAAQNLKDTLSALLADLGAFLDIGLYREALLHLMRGSAVGIRPVEIKVSGRVVGAQSMCMLNEDTAWHLSGIRHRVRSYESHLIRLLNHTSLNRIQWVNLRNQIVTLKTLRK
jgi:GxxExxY protein